MLNTRIVVVVVAVVRYARQIVKHDDAVAGETVEATAARARKLARQKGRSGWPEFAVKVSSQGGHVYIAMRGLVGGVDV